VSELIDRQTQTWAVAAVVAGVALSIGLELWETPGMSAAEIGLELLSTLPVVMTSVGLALLFRVAGRQREEQRTLVRELEVARVQGQRWRSEARSLLNGLGEAIDVQFSRWNLTEAEREVALLLLKGLSLKEIAAIRATTERTVRAQARALYGKAGLTGRASLSAFFLEDLLAPIADGREEET
jgi:DNA-binding CsgD family transcriptional regulator